MAYREIRLLLAVLAAEFAFSSSFVLPVASPFPSRQFHRHDSGIYEVQDRTAGRRAAFGVRQKVLANRNVDHACEMKASISVRNDTIFVSPFPLVAPTWPPSGVANQPDPPTLGNPLEDLSSRKGVASPYNEKDQQSAFGSPRQVAGVAATALSVLAAGATWWLATHCFPGEDTAGVSASASLVSISTWIQQLISHPQETLQSVVDSVHDMGNAGLLYFGLIYLVAEVLAVPATPLTLSAGVLFGVAKGTAIVLLSASIAASVAFWIGKTVLRSWVEERLQENPKFAKLDRAIGEQGFQLLLLVRLSPIFPFALSNYLYGASSISFLPYFFGTLLGFAPGTLAYVYTGTVGKALTLGGADGASQPWYVYAGALAVLAGLLSLVSQVASSIIESMDEEGTDATTSTSITL